MAVNEKVELATFAGGCFWCMVSPFEEMEGIIKVVSGYTGGHKENPTYKEVCSETTGHYEAVQITFDANKMPYEELLNIYWRQIDPTDVGGQFHDRGQSYETVIFITMKNNIKGQRLQKKSLRRVSAFQNRLRQKYCQLLHFIQLRNIIKDIIRKIHSAMSYIVKVRGEMLLLSNIGQRIMLI